MSSDATSKPSAAIWQGFHHAWAYNHRLNRFGSYVRSRRTRGGREIVVGHTAASGTGGDTAHVSEYLTRVEPLGVAFQTGEGETIVECPRAVTTPFRIRIDGLSLAPDMIGRESYTVLINGFDLYAQRHADKLIAFDLEVTQPTVDANSGRMRFDVIGELCFDCRTAECQLWPLTLEVERIGQRRRVPDAAEPASSVPRQRRGIRKRPAFEQGINWLKRQVARLTDLENVKRGILGRDEDRLRRRILRFFGRQFFFRLLKWRIITPYVLRVHYLIVAGEDNALRVTESELIENSYTWDAETEIQFEDAGSRPVAVVGGCPDQYAINTFGFKRLCLITELDQHFSSSNPIQWGKGMHMLEWTTAVGDIKPSGDSVTGKLDLFYKSWSKAMNEVITFTTWGAVRSAGSARLAARLALLQFKHATPSVQRVLPGRIHWPGGGLNAASDPRACLERPAKGTEGTDCDA